MMRQKGLEVVVLFCLLGLSVASCSKSKTPVNASSPSQPTTSASAAAPSASAAASPSNYACTLLTNEEIAAVQGEPPKSTKPSEKSAAGMTVSQCYFELPTTVNSIVVTVTRKADGGRDPSQSWQEIFHSERRAEKKEEEEKNEPQKIEGVGDEAFWNGTRIGGALFVLKGNSYIRISVGGAGDQAAKIEKCKALAISALKRL